MTIPTDHAHEVTSEGTQPSISIFTDGACSNNGQSNPQGGWGAVLMNGQGHRLKIAGKLQGDTITNNRAELMAAIKALALPICHMAALPGGHSEGSPPWRGQWTRWNVIHLHSPDSVRRSLSQRNGTPMGLLPARLRLLVSVLDLEERDSCRFSSSDHPGHFVAHI